MREFDAAADAEKRDFLRAIAEEVRGETGESEQVAALLYRVSDLYDDAEDTTTEDVYRNVRNVLRIRERGTLERDRE